MSESTTWLAIELPVEVKEEWQVKEICEGLREADAGEFASAEEVAAVFTKWLHAR